MQTLTLVTFVLFFLIVVGFSMWKSRCKAGAAEGESDYFLGGRTLPSATDIISTAERIFCGFTVPSKLRRFIFSAPLSSSNRDFNPATNSGSCFSGVLEISEIKVPHAGLSVAG